MAFVMHADDCVCDTAFASRVHITRLSFYKRTLTQSATRTYSTLSDKQPLTPVHDAGSNDKRNSLQPCTAARRADALDNGFDFDFDNEIK